MALLEIGLSDNVIKTEDDVEDLLNIFDEIKCCEGVTPSKALLNKICSAKILLNLMVYGGTTIVQQYSKMMMGKLNTKHIIGSNVSLC